MLVAMLGGQRGRVPDNRNSRSSGVPVRLNLYPVGATYVPLEAFGADFYDWHP